MKVGTAQKYAHLPHVKEDAALAIDYCINDLVVCPNNIHLFALDHDRAFIEEKLVEDDPKYVPKDEKCQIPDQNVPMKWKPHVKAKYDMLY